MTHGEGVNIQAKTEGKILKLCVLASRAIQKFLFGEMHLVRGIVFSILLSQSFFGGVKNLQESIGRREQQKVWAETKTFLDTFWMV